MVKKRSLNALGLTDYIIMAIIILMIALIVVPFMNVIAISFSSNAAVLGNRNMLFPRQFTIKAYEALFRSVGVWRGLGISVFITVTTTFLHLCLTLMMGYVLSRRNLPLRKALTIFTLLTMIFSGGLIPTYKAISEYGMLDSLSVLIIPGCVSAYSVMLMKNFIAEIPESIEEAAVIDGVGHIRLLISIIAPMSVPVLCTLAVFCAVGKWNDWTSAFIYINTRTELYPLQNIVKDIAVEFDSASLKGFNFSDSTYAFQMATIVFVSLPIAIVYPFLQKYFEKGIYLGSEK